MAISFAGWNPIVSSVGGRGLVVYQTDDDAATVEADGYFDEVKEELYAMDYPLMLAECSDGIRFIHIELHDGSIKKTTKKANFAAKRTVPKKKE